MIGLLRRLVLLLPSLALAFALALAVWVSAVTSADPNEVRIYPRPVQVEILGQDPGLVLVSGTPINVSVNLNAPRTVWDRLANEEGLVRAMIDLSGLGAGTHNVEVQVEVGLRTVKKVSVTPRLVTIKLENLATATLPILLVRQGEPAIGFQAEAPELSQENALVSGPETQVALVKQVRAVLELAGAHENISTTILLQAMDANEEEISGVTLNPERITVVQAITQRGGFRSDLVVKPVYRGSLAPGYRLTNISVFPPAVTVFSSNPQRVNDLPGYIETGPINLDGASDDLEIKVELVLPDGVTLVGDQQVTVQVGIAAIESSITLSGLSVEVRNLGPNLHAEITPLTVDLILAGPLPVLDRLTRADVRVFVDASGLTSGTQQLKPQVEITAGDLQVISLIPELVEVRLLPGSPTATPTILPTSKP